MRRYVLWAVLAAVLAAGPVGCGKKEIEELTTKVGQLQKEMDLTKADLAEKSRQAEESATKASQLQAKGDAQASDISKLRAERDKLKRELSALKKKKKR